MENLSHLIIVFLAAWRITSAVNRETIGQPIRYFLAHERLDKMTNIESYSNSFLAKMITCFMCLSFWVALFCVLIYAIFPLFLYPFAISTLVIFLEKAY